MARDGGGVYALPAGSVFVNATVIDEVVMNALIADIEADLNVDRPIVAGGTGASGAVGARTNLGLKTPLSGIDTTGSANAYLFATSDALTPSNGDTIVLVASFAVTGAATLDVDSSGAKDIKKVVAGTLVALVTGDIVANALYLLTYDSSATAWIVINPGGGSGADSIIADAGGLITATTIEGALAELAASIFDDTLVSLAAVEGVAGDILFASGTDAWDRLAKGADGEVLTLASGIPAWATFIGITPETAIATTSGTAHDFTSIPAGTNRITMMLDGVSLSGDNPLLVQIGDAGGIEATGYISKVLATAETTGFILTTSPLAAESFSGLAIFDRVDGNTWVFSGNMAPTEAGDTLSVSAGTKTLSAELTQIRLTRVGSDTFDAGKINIFTE